MVVFRPVANDTIPVQATDDSAVAEVILQILDLNGVVLEKEQAMQAGTPDAWIYRSTRPLSHNQTISVVATAKDHPGNVSTRNYLAYVRDIQSRRIADPFPRSLTRNSTRLFASRVRLGRSAGSVAD